MDRIKSVHVGVVWYEQAQKAMAEITTLRATIEAKDADLTAMTSRYSRAAADIASLELELAAQREFLDEMAYRGGIARVILDIEGHWFTDQYNEFRAAIDDAKEE